MAPTSTNLFKVEEANGVLTVTFSSGEPLNYLTITALNELDRFVTEWADPRYRAIVIQSDPVEVGFITHFSGEELYDLIKGTRNVTLFGDRCSSVQGTLGQVLRVMIMSVLRSTMTVLVAPAEIAGVNRLLHLAVSCQNAQPKRPASRIRS